MTEWLAEPPSTEFGQYGYGDGVISNSEIHGAIGCAYQWYVKHVLKRKDIKEQSYLTLGKLVHHVIELFYDHPAADNVTQQADQLEVLEALLHTTLHEVFSPEVVTKLKMFDALQKNAVADSIRVFEDRNPGKTSKNPTATNYYKENYQEVLANFAMKQVQPLASQTPGIIFTRPLAFIYSDAVTCLANFLTLHREQEYPFQGYILTEYKITPFEVCRELKGGTIDRIEVYLDEDGSISKICVGDYKTGREPFRLNDVANSDQLCWYAYAVEKEFGVLPEIIEIWNLQQATRTSHKLNQSDIDRWQLRVQSNINYLNTLRAVISSQAPTTSEAAQPLDLLEAVIPFLPVPAGLKAKYVACNNCTLPYETDPELKCPYREDYEGQKELSEADYVS